MAAKARNRPRRGHRPNAKSLANLKPAAKGEVRNPTGRNGWTAARERIRDLLASESADEIVAVMQRLAKAGDVAAAKLVLGPLLPAQEVKAEVEGEVVVRFAREGEVQKT